MKKLIILLLGLLIPASSLLAQYKLEIEIEGLRNNDGTIMLQLFDSNEKVVKQEMGSISDKHSSIIITGLIPGKYAIRFYHDENANMKMETNFVGKPTEGYGFSNNVKGKFGPPPFDKWLFNIDSDKKIVLKPVY